MARRPCLHPKNASDSKRNVPQLHAAGLYAFFKVGEFETTTQHMRNAIYCNADDGQDIADAISYLKDYPES